MVLNSLQPIKLDNFNNIKNNFCKLIRYSNKSYVFKEGEQCSLAADIILKTPLVPYDQIDFSKFSDHHPELITDDNMITEFKYGKRLLN